METKTHELKIWIDFFEPVNDGTKKFEVRNNDRKFKVGDIAWFREYDDRKGKYTGRECRCRITYVLEGIGQGSIPPLHGLVRGFAVISLEKIDG